MAGAGSDFVTMSLNDDVARGAVGARGAAAPASADAAAADDADDAVALEGLLAALPRAAPRAAAALADAVGAILNRALPGAGGGRDVASVGDVGDTGGGVPCCSGSPDGGTGRGAAGGASGDDDLRFGTVGGADRTRPRSLLVHFLRKYRGG